MSRRPSDRDVLAALPATPTGLVRKLGTNMRVVSASLSRLSTDGLVTKRKRTWYRRGEAPSPQRRTGPRLNPAADKRAADDRHWWLEPSAATCSACDATAQPSYRLPQTGRVLCSACAVERGVDRMAKESKAWRAQVAAARRKAA